MVHTGLLQAAACTALLVLLLVLGWVGVEPLRASAARGARGPGDEPPVPVRHPRRLEEQRPAEPAAPQAASAAQRLHGVVKASWAHRQAEVPTGASYAECKIDAAESCPMSRMTGPTLVYPGGATACLNGDSFAFFVTPGVLDELVFYLQGGGGCWDSASFGLGACSRSLADALRLSGTRRGRGIFDATEERNGLRGRTVVEVLYCSGDAHVGNATRRWRGLNPQVGYRNVLAALAWTLRNTQSRLSSLVLMGDSAGALGTQAWADYLLGEKFTYDRAAVLVDSYVGVFPPGTTAPILKSFGACGLPLFDPDERALCRDGVVTFQAIVKKAIAKHGSVPFGFLQSKEDAVQCAFFDLVAMTYGRARFITGPELYYETNVWFARYNALPNFVAMYVDGDAHTFTGSDYYYTAGTLGSRNGSSAGQPPMYQWVNSLVGGHGCPSAQCAGSLSANSRLTAAYCDEGLFPKACRTSR